TLGAYWNYEAIQLAQLHKHPTVIPVDRVGVPTYDELVLVAKQTTILRRPDVLRRFVQALGRGYESARRDPAGAVANLLAANPGLDAKFQRAAVDATLPAFFPAGSSHPWGWQDQAQWTRFGEWMLHEHLISQPSDLVNASTNDFLAGVGP
ncbi:MAG TPA: ABC transporter substrate-binding protein, partial [Solirubrobacteraceae bacterium]|nr:ABC transporter substrate-binding protein [Solirubrobacteraceae bacterium]